MGEYLWSYKEAPEATRGTIGYTTDVRVGIPDRTTSQYAVHRNSHVAVSVRVVVWAAILGHMR